MTDRSPAFRLFTEIGIIAQLSQTLFESVLPDGMTLAQFTVLNHLTNRGAKAPAELARAFQVTKPTMTSTLHRLEAKSFVRIEPDPKDGRAKRVELTPAGAGARARCIAALDPTLAKLGEVWPAGETEALLPHLVRLRCVLDENRDLAERASAPD